MQPTTQQQCSRNGHLETGVALIVLGTVFLCMKFNIIQLEWHWYTFLAIAFAAMGGMEMLLAKRPHKIFEGFSKIILGAWFYVAFSGLWGVTPGNSWPVFLILAGTGIMLKSLSGKDTGKNISTTSDTKSE